LESIHLKKKKKSAFKLKKTGWGHEKHVLYAATKKHVQF
jgi:hypothetical protein